MKTNDKTNPSNDQPKYHLSLHPPMLLTAMVQAVKSACLRCKRSPDHDPSEVFAMAYDVANSIRQWGEKIAAAPLVWPKDFTPTTRMLEQAAAIKEAGMKAAQEHQNVANALEAAVEQGKADWMQMHSLSNGGKGSSTEMTTRAQATAKGMLQRIERVMEGVAAGMKRGDVVRKIKIGRQGTTTAGAFPGKTDIPPSAIALLAEFADPGLEQMASTALQERDWLGFFLRMSSHGNSRLAALVELRKFLADADYWECVRTVWINTEITWPDLDTWRHLFNERPGRHQMMTVGEIDELKKLPEEVVVYRGFAGRYRDGISWTLSREKAEFFAKYSVGPRRSFVCGKFATGTPKIVTGKCKKSDILALNNDRGEQDVIVFPEQVRDKRVENWHAKTREAAA